MPLHVVRHGGQKPCIILLILLTFLCSYLFGYAVDSYFDSTKQSNIYLHWQLPNGNVSSVQRAILIFYPSTQKEHYSTEVRWLYRSWIEMMKNESRYWRTDLIVYTEEYLSEFEQLGCTRNEVRRNYTEPPRCRIILYRRILSRIISATTQQQALFAEHGKRDLFQIDVTRAAQLHRQLSSYGYIDSVNIVAEGYPTFQYYDFILKTDVDVFVTRQFAKYIPTTPNTLLVGLGGYSTEFNTRRLGRIAHDMNWQNQNMTSIGSTWYGSPYMAQRIANFTLDAMLYLHMYEFAPAERQQKLGTLLWPDWHYGVLSMYGTHLAVNHLLVAEKFDIKKADQLLDQSTTNSDQYDLEKNNRLHLHCWHTEKRFSKFQFKAGAYSNIHPRTLLNDSSAQAYALRMALESQLMSLNELGQRLRDIGTNKALQ